jgi:hypothetical protein
MTPVERYQNDHQEALAILCGIVAVAGGRVSWLKASRAFTLLYRPSTMLRFMPPDLRREAKAWAASAKHRERLTGMLAFADGYLVDGVLSAETVEGRRWLVRSEAKPMPEVPFFTREECEVALTLADLIQD